MNRTKKQVRDIRKGLYNFRNAFFELCYALDCLHTYDPAIADTIEDEVIDDRIQNALSVAYPFDSLDGDFCEIDIPYWVSVADELLNEIEEELKK